jgi:AcrR family transcriptional regulator
VSADRARAAVATPLTREQILDATETVLRRRGPTKATVIDVSRLLGVSHASIYRHFTSKAALRQSVTERWLAQVIDPLGAIVTAHGPAIERVRRWFDTLAATKRDLARRDPDLFATYLQLLEDSPGMVDIHVGALLDQLTAIVAQGTADGTIASTDPHTTARAAFHAMSRFHHPLHVGYWQHPDLNDHYENVWRLLCTGLCP